MSTKTKPSYTPKPENPDSSGPLQKTSTQMFVQIPFNFDHLEEEMEIDHA